MPTYISAGLTYVSSCHHECRLVLRYARIFVLFLVSFFKACSIPPIKTHCLNQDQNVDIWYLFVRLIVFAFFNINLIFFNFSRLIPMRRWYVNYHAMKVYNAMPVESRRAFLMFKEQCEVLDLLVKSTFVFFFVKFSFFI
jgi:hypothetical protein